MPKIKLTKRKSKNDTTTSVSESQSKKIIKITRKNIKSANKSDNKSENKSERKKYSNSHSPTNTNNILEKQLSLKNMKIGGQTGTKMNFKYIF